MLRLRKFSNFKRVYWDGEDPIAIQPYLSYKNDISLTIKELRIGVGLFDRSAINGVVEVERSERSRSTTIPRVADLKHFSLLQPSYAKSNEAKMATNQ